MAFQLGAQAKPSPVPLAIKAYPIQSAERQKLTSEYAKLHYGIDDWHLVDPQLIIVHFTGSDSDAVSLSVFKPLRLGKDRPDIEAGGSLNVGIHYVISKDGTIWSLLPESDMGRHAIGFNHVALGIEMTGSSGAKLTKAQLAVCAALVADMARRNPSVRYLCGHHEYVQTTRAHYKLYRELMPNFPPTVKVDPGTEFMTNLRSTLKVKYQLVLQD